MFQLQLARQVGLEFEALEDPRVREMVGKRTGQAMIKGEGGFAGRPE